MADATAAKRGLRTPNKKKKKKKKRSNSQSSSPSLPPTPLSATPRRSTRRTALHFQDPTTPINKIPKSISTPIDDHAKSGRKENKSNQLKSKQDEEEKVEFSPASPEPLERKKRKRGQEKTQVFYNKVVYDGGEFEVRDDVYVKRRDDDGEAAAQVEEHCRVCFKAGKAVMIECDDCLGGFHLKCLKPPLKEVPEGDWVCGFCEARKFGKEVKLPVPPPGKKLVRTFREKLLTSDLWAARIQR